MAGRYRATMAAIGIDEPTQHKLFVVNPRRVLASTGEDRNA
jgi:hypothetical protein